MRTLACLLSAIMICAWPACASAAVKVNLVNPEHYIDAGPYGRDRARNLAEIEKAFRDLGDRYLSAGQTLTIEILDIDLAGQLEPWHFNNYDTRFMRDITWPRMKLRYTLERGGQPLLRAEETLSDPSYLERPNTHFSNEPLPYEKAMMERWFRAKPRT
jgi:Protein of unknown function (DUF3016)